MDVYELSVDLRNGVRDMDLVTALDGYLGLLQEREGLIESWRLLRRKLGLGEGSEFKVLIETTTSRSWTRPSSRCRAGRTRSSPPTTGSTRW